MREQIAKSARQAVEALLGVIGVEVVPSEMTPEERRALFGGTPPAPPKLAQFNQIKQVVAVMSGKGGVGKSSVTALLAVALARLGLKVGVLDADITGPSIPKLFGLPTGGVDGNAMGILPPVTAEGVRVMSVNLLVRGEDDPILWRGPIISGIIKQFWTDVIWSKLDTLLVDLPPGTSDATLTVIQSLPVNGVVLVTTPQELATMVVPKAVNMLNQLNIPIVGLVENMSYFVCPETGSQHAIFRPSHTREIAAMVGIPTWTSLQIDSQIAVAGDNGQIGTLNLEEIEGLVDKLAQPAAVRS